MKMTKAQRHECYKKALIQIKKMPDNAGHGVCLILDSIAGVATHEVLGIFTEYANKRPKSRKYSNVFCNDNATGKKKRILWLNQCIKETASKSKTK